MRAHGRYAHLAMPIEFPLLASFTASVMTRALPPITDKGALLEWLAWGSGMGLVLVAIVAAGLADVWATDARSVRRFSRRAWFLLVAVPLAGLAAWIVVGRPRGRRRTGGARPTSSTQRPKRSGHSSSAKLHVVPSLTAAEELNAQLARSEELNRQLEEWEAQRQRDTTTSTPAPLRQAKQPDRDDAKPSASSTPAEKRLNDAIAPVAPDPKSGDLSAWEADLRRWEEELHKGETPE